MTRLNSYNEFFNIYKILRLRESVYGFQNFLFLFFKKLKKLEFLENFSRLLQTWELRLRFWIFTFRCFRTKKFVKQMFNEHYYESNLFYHFISFIDVLNVFYKQLLKIFIVKYQHCLNCFWSRAVNISFINLEFILRWCSIEFNSNQLT